MNFVHLLVFFLDLKPISAAAKRARAASFFLLIRCRRAPPPQRAIPSGGRGVEHRAGHLLTDGTYHSPRHLPPPSTHFPAHSRTLCLAPPLICWKLSVGECVREYETQFAASVCVCRTRADSVELLPRDRRALAFPRSPHGFSCSTRLAVRSCFGDLDGFG